MKIDAVHINGVEQSLVDPTLADAGLPPAVGVHSIQIFRASRDAVQLSDGRGWTYHHHVDMACWRGRLYVGWNSCERDEDVWPCRELYSSSADGLAWPAPRELFPQGVSTALRMYFYHAANDTMLAIAGLRLDQSDTDEDKKFGLVVREIRPDHSLGEVHLLQPVDGHSVSLPHFEAASNAAFVAACRLLLADTIFLEQQDRGRLLGSRRMKWHDPQAWPQRQVPGDDSKWVCGKAFSFFRRPDGDIVGISKMGWTTTSSDSGRTWSEPAVPASLITGKAKVWGQQTADGRYALVYNPSRRNRFPLVLCSGSDGISFGSMRVVQGELPRQRYAGMHRSIGPQYVRGISAWADDGSRQGEQVLWLTYSMNKEDIWVSAIPLPVQSTEVDAVDDDFSGAHANVLAAKWNTYCPRWATIGVADGGLQMECTDPYDYASAARVFPKMQAAEILLQIQIPERTSAPIDIDLFSEFGSRRPVQIRLLQSGAIAAWRDDSWNTIGQWQLRRPLVLRLAVHCRTSKWTLTHDDAGSVQLPFAMAADDVQRITVRTGAYRNIGGADPVGAGTDYPVEPRQVRIDRLQVRPLPSAAASADRAKQM